MLRLLSILSSASLIVSAWMLCGCHREEAKSGVGYGFEEYRAIYNTYIREWLAEQQTATQSEIAKVTTALETAADHQKGPLESQLATLRAEAEKWSFRLALGDYFKIGTPEEIPNDLVWENGMDQPEIGDPAAVKGGAFRRYILGFPPTIRPFGENSNNSFRGDLYDMIDVPLAGLHPETMQPIPGLAREWALSKDKRTVYFRLDPQATYSDGVKVRASDFHYGAYYRISDFIINPYGKQYFRENLAQIAVYDEETISISLPEAQLYGVAIAGSLGPSPPHFYDDYGPDYNERYQWAFPPTTGAYEVLPDDIVMGVSITQSRVKNWWAKDRKYYRHRYNPDKIVHTVVRDESKAFELFRAGLLDTFSLTLPNFWYEKCEMDPVYKGWIERVTYYNQYPRVPRGLYINVHNPPLDDRNVRLGIHHAMNWRKVIDQMFRGDFKRLHAFNEGFINLSDPTIRSRKYSVAKAREYFQAAGFFEENSEGILIRQDGTPLSVSVTYPTMPLLDRMFAILREDAKACGLDLRLDGLEATVSYTKVMQKQHDMTFSSWLVTPPFPDFHQFLHSSNAYDGNGNLKTQTNNIFSWARADTDMLSEKARTGTTIEEVRDAVQKLQHIMHEEGMFVPGYTSDFVRIGSWRWVRWPDCESTRFSPPVVYDPHDSFVYWVDEKLLSETQQARRSGISFGESTKVVDAYKEVAKPKNPEPTEPQSAPAPDPTTPSEP